VVRYESKCFENNYIIELRSKIRQNNYLKNQYKIQVCEAEAYVYAY
jgi:hypothetical protein